MHGVPYYSQYDEGVPEEWRDRACGIVCLKMALEVSSSGTYGVLDLIKEAESIKPYDPETGWSHQVLVLIAHNHGVPAYQEEFKSREPRLEEQLAQYGVRKFKDELARGRTILVSVPKGLKEGGSSHMILLTGVKGNSFVYSDPAAQSSTSGANLALSEDDFFKHWRRLSVIVG